MSGFQSYLVGKKVEDGGKKMISSCLFEMILSGKRIELYGVQ